MHSSCTDRPIYTGAQMFRFAPPFGGPIIGHHPQHEPHGFCHSCCHPRSHCMCVRRECRKEARELVVNSDAATSANTTDTQTSGTLGLLRNMVKTDSLATNSASSEETALRALKPIRKVASETAFIGGGCCVHLSVEYMANLATQASRIIVAVEDSEGTTLVWERAESAGTPYRTKEGIVTTKPGAKLTVIVSNATARVRWCEIFSC